MTGRAGTSVIESVVAAGLAAVALAGLAGTAALVAGTLGLVRDGGQALVLATGRLEVLRAAQGADGADTTLVAPATRFMRTWRVSDGRGRASALAVEVRWGARQVMLSTETPP